MEEILSGIPTKKVFLLGSGSVGKTYYVNKLSDILGYKKKITKQLYENNITNLILKPDNGEPFSIMDFADNFLDPIVLKKYIEIYKPFGFIFMYHEINDRSHMSVTNLCKNINDYISQNNSKVLFISNKTQYSCPSSPLGHFIEPEDKESFTEYYLNLHTSPDLDIVKSLEKFIISEDDHPVEIKLPIRIRGKIYFEVHEDLDKEEFGKLQSKTIKSLKRLKKPNYVDDSYVLIEFTDGSD